MSAPIAYVIGTSRSDLLPRPFFVLLDHGLDASLVPNGRLVQIGDRLRLVTNIRSPRIRERLVKYAYKLYMVPTAPRTPRKILGFDTPPQTPRKLLRYRQYPTPSLGLILVVS